jgi:hypothetical protein
MKRILVAALFLGFSHGVAYAHSGGDRAVLTVVVAAVAAVMWMLSVSEG